MINQVSVNTLKPYPNNARTHSDKQIDQIAKSIEAFGFNNPILVDENGMIIAGHGRLLAAQKIGLSQVPSITLSHLSPAQRQAYILADNKIALNADWSIDKLQSEFQSLLNMDFDVSLTGFSQDEINTFLNPEILNEGLCDPDDVPEIQEEPINKMGDIWILGNHRLRCGDSTYESHVKDLCKDFNLILMITDPPYGVNHNPSWRDEYCIGKRGFSDKHANSKGLVQNDNQVDWHQAYLLFGGDIAYVWHSAKFTHIVINNLIDCGFEPICQIIWSKHHFSFGRGDYHWQHEPCWYAVRKGCNHNWKGDRKQTTLWQIQSLNPIGQTKNEWKEKEEKTGHSTQKPIECMIRPILNNSEINDYIYDPFGGSGTTLVACEKTNRKCFMMEISPHYCDVIIKRWQKFTGKDAILESNGKTFNEISHDS